MKLNSRSHKTFRSVSLDGRKLRFELCEPRAMLAAASVTSSADSGPGSFRAAIEAANSDPAITSVVFERRIETVRIGSSVEYSGAQALRIDGNKVNIQPADGLQGDFDLFLASGGADLSLAEITFRGGANGVVVAPPLDATGNVEVSLRNVTIRDNDLFGLHIVDMTEIPPPPEDPEADPSQIGSDAGVVLSVVDSQILGNGTAAHDRDGIRVDERGAGDIEVRILASRLNGNGAEGIELDEGGEGGVSLHAAASTFDANGFISTGDPEDPDFDDGIDIDEAGVGSVSVVLLGITANGNFDEGIDLNEGDEGDLTVVIVGVEANNNTDQGIALEEAGDGGIHATLTAVRARHNGADGLRFEEFDAGDLAVDIAFSQIDDNGGFGVYASQAQPGSGSVRLRGVSLRRNAEGRFNTTIENEETGEEEDSGVVFS